MLNHKNNVHKAQKSKSKIFITILCIFGLLFSYSCSCKNNVTGPGNDGLEDGKVTNINPDTFAIKEATGNVVASIVQSAKTVGDIKIAFAEANNHDYTMDYTVDDANETVEANKIDKSDFQLANKVLTAKESLLTKVKALNTDNWPAEKTITINFTFTATDATLKNNTQTLSVEVKLTHAQSLDDNKVLEELKEIGVCYGFEFVSATVNNNVFSVGEDSPINSELTTDGFIPALNERISGRQEIGKLQKLNRLDYIDKVEVSTDKKTATFHFKLILDDKYDPIYNEETNPLKIELKIAKGTGTWKDTSTPQS